MFRQSVASRLVQNSSVKTLAIYNNIRFISSSQTLLKPALAAETTEYLPTGGSTQSAWPKGFRQAKPKTWEEGHAFLFVSFLKMLLHHLPRRPFHRHLHHQSIFQHCNHHLHPRHQIHRPYPPPH